MARVISTTIDIAATPETVWAVLADLASYPEWHPVFRKVSGSLTPGSKLTIDTTIPSSGRDMTVKVKVITADPGRELQWVSRMLGVTYSKRTFVLTRDGTGTSLEQAGSYTGLGGTRPGYGGRNTYAVLDRIRGTLESINEAIKEQAEARQQAAGTGG